MDEPTARRGRPKKEGGAKNAPLNMRTTPWLRERIEEAAEHFGTSLSSEVERRLISSFLFDQANGGPNVATFAHLVAASIHEIQERSGKQWVTDPATFNAVKGVVNQLLEMKRPIGNALAPNWPTLDDTNAAMRRADEAERNYREFLEANNCADETLEQLTTLGPEQMKAWGHLSREHRKSMETAIMVSEKFIEKAQEREHLATIAAEVVGEMYDRIGPKTGE